MTSGLTLPRLWRLTVVLPLLFGLCLIASPLPVVAQSQDAETISRMAMSTASLWMMEHHEHEIDEALGQGDLEEALEEAEELIPWMEGTPWLSELTVPAQAAAGAVTEVVERLKARDEAGARSAFETMRKKFHHLHHELMEVVGGKASH